MLSESMIEHSSWCDAVLCAWILVYHRCCAFYM